MFDTRVIGVDPGVARLGIAILERRDRRCRIVWSATIRTEPDRSEAQRLQALGAAVRGAVAEHAPSSLALERVAWNVNKRSAMAVARATGVVMALAAEAGLPVAEYGPLEVKNAVAGSGGVSKSQIHDALTRLHGLADVPQEPDAADAVAVALTHLVRSRFTAAADRAAAR
jgi:crossover junction endodeoxyribonuclease RuvC